MSRCARRRSPSLLLRSRLLATVRLRLRPYPRQAPPRRLPPPAPLGVRPAHAPRPCRCLPLHQPPAAGDPRSEPRQEGQRAWHPSATRRGAERAREGRRGRGERAGQEGAASRGCIRCDRVGLEWVSYVSRGAHVHVFNAVAFSPFLSSFLCATIPVSRCEVRYPEQGGKCG